MLENCRVFTYIVDMVIDAFDKLSINPEKTRRIDGKKIAQEVIVKLKERSAGRRTKKFFGAFLVGDDPASISFLKQKEKIAKELGIDFRLYTFPASASQDALRKEVGKIAAHKNCGGLTVQLPLPNNLDRHYVCNAIPREKDADVLGERALGAFYTERNPVLPPAVGVVNKILSSLNVELSSSHITLVGRGFLVGRPIAVWLMYQAKELYILGRNSDLSILKQADLVITGAGKPGLIKPEMLKGDAVVIDFGYAEVDGKLTGDFDSSLVIGYKSSVSYTPTPGGTGPVLVAQLFENFYTLCDKI